MVLNGFLFVAGTTLVMNSEAKASRSSPAKVSSHVPFSISAVTTSRTVPAPLTSFTSIASDTIIKNEKRLYNAEMRKNRRNKKEKLLEAAGTKESHTAGNSKSSALATSNSSPMTSTSGKVGLHSNNPCSSDMPGSSASLTNSNSSTSQSSANSKRKRNDIVKPVGAGKSGKHI